MKITLDASIKEHREIAELFRGSKIGHSKAVFKRIGPTAYLLGVDHIKGGFFWYLIDFGYQFYSV